MLVIQQKINLIVSKPLGMKALLDKISISKLVYTL